MARSHHHSDPLDLLLDTMTNAFGAIIMIAISVSLFVNETKKATDPTATTKAQMTQRKSAQTAEEIEAAKKLKVELEEKLQQAGDVAQMIRDRDALLEKVRVAEVDLKSESQTPDAKPDLLRSKVADLSSAMMALKENVARLTLQSQALGKLAASNQTKQTIDVTPPSPVADTLKSPFNLIFRHKRLYPLRILGPDGKSVVANEAAVKWIPLTNGVEIKGMEVEPIPGAGIDAEKNEAAVRDFIAMLRQIHVSLEKGSDLYVAAYVYKDSFDAYIRFKQLFTIANTGIEVGWEPVADDDNRRFGTDGFKPGVQK